MMLSEPGARLVLASTSAARRTMLAAAGVAVETVAPGVDEAAVKQALKAQEGDVEPGDLALILAQTKCTVVSERHPGALVIGADQVLAMDGQIFEKPGSMDAAREQLLALRGRTHALHSAVACARDGEVLWSHQDEAVLTMRAFSNGFLGRYVAAAGDALLTSVGAYQVEGPGIQLFEEIEGDHFTILGLPLLPLLDFLRREEALPA